MNLFFYIVLLTLGQTLGNRNCENASFKNSEIETLAINFTMPYQLAVDPNTNTLFFSYSLQNSEESFKIVYLDLNNQKRGEVTGISGGFAQTVDVKNRVVYLGGSDGIYQFDYETKSANRLNITKNSIWQMFFKEYLYYTISLNEEAYVYKDGVAAKVKQLENTRASLIAVDNNHNIYFANSSGLYVNDNDNAIKHIGDYIINGFTSDINGNIFFSTLDKIYSIISGTSVKQIIELNDIHGLAIDAKGNYIYSTYNTVKRLKLDVTNCS